MSEGEGRTRGARGPGRLRIGLNVIVQMAALALIVGVVNHFAFNNYRRWDVSRENQESLSSQTRNYLRKLRQPVRLIVFFQRDNPIYPDVDNLVKEYQHASDRRISVEHVDPVRGYGRAIELQKRYKFGAQESIVIVDAGERFRFVTAAEMADLDRSGEVLGRAPRVVTFKGEQALTAALIDVVEARQRIVRVLEGHGQAAVGEGTEYARLREFLARQNLRVEPLNLAVERDVPEGADAVLFMGAKTDLGQGEIEALERYWERSGRLLLFRPWGIACPRLDGLLGSLGIRANGDRVLSTLDMGLGKQVVGLMRDVIGRAVGDHPVVARMKETNLSFRGATGSFSLDQEVARARRVRLQGLIVANAPYWGERDHAAVESGAAPRYDAGRDLPPPLLFAVAAERGTVVDGRLAVVNSSRLIAVGNSSCLVNDGLTEGAIDLTINSINWLLDRKELIGIAPKPARSFPHDLGEGQMRDLLGYVLLISVLPLGLGFVMWWVRSH